jgi:hypothetical protein
VERNRFDEAVRHLGVGASRRQLLGGLIGSAAAALAGVALGSDEAIAAKKGPKSKKTKSNKGNQKGVGKGKGIGQGNGGGHAGGNGNGNGPAKPKTRGFNAEALGTVTSEALAGCNDPNGLQSGICTTGFGGEGSADHLGKITFGSSLTADWSQARLKDIDSDLYCAPIIEGNATLTAVSNSKNPKGSVELKIKDGTDETGNPFVTVCESDPDVGYPLVLNGVYLIVGGTENFAGATGEVTVSGSMEGAEVEALASFTATGKIVY